MKRSQLIGLMSLAALGCSGGKAGGGGEGPEGPGGPGGSVMGTTVDGVSHVISDGWEEVPVVGGDNVKMLSFVQMTQEVERATAVAWSGWAGARPTFGGADYQNSFVEDTIPTGTKMVAWRKMAYDVCGQLISRESQSPAIFQTLSPTAALSSSDPKVRTQAGLLFERFFLESGGAAELDQSVTALGSIKGAGATSSEAWTGLCVAYLATSRFLSY